MTHCARVALASFLTASGSAKGAVPSFRIELRSEAASVRRVRTGIRSVRDGTRSVRTRTRRGRDATSSLQAAIRSVTVENGSLRIEFRGDESWVVAFKPQSVALEARLLAC